jgi:hypothetical protein
MVFFVGLVSLGLLSLSWSKLRVAVEYRGSSPGTVKNDADFAPAGTSDAETPLPGGEGETHSQDSDEGSHLNDVLPKNPEPSFDDIFQEVDLDVESSGTSASSSGSTSTHGKKQKPHTPRREELLRQELVLDSVPLIGPLARCRAECRLCSEMQLDNRDVFVPKYVAEYIRSHVLISVITGSFERFFRVDLMLCSWLSHVPRENLFVLTDKSKWNDGRHGRWLEAKLPKDVVFSKKQMAAKGYTIHWIRAQYRFFQAFSVMNDAIERNASVHGRIRWMIVLDDDTIADLTAMVHMLMEHDAAQLKRLGSLPETISPYRLQDPGAWKAVDGLVDGASRAFAPLYLGDEGWGGAGHFMNLAAALVFHKRGAEECVAKFMVKKFYASDVTLKRCVPAMGIRVVNDKRLSHCQAVYLRKKLLSGTHVTTHVKRDVVPPRALAMWRVRLYYQVIYHRNTSAAFDLLMNVGACAYGASCKLRHCGVKEDAQRLSFFLNVSGNNSFVPFL